jgi:hypothetical protein
MFPFPSFKCSLSTFYLHIKINVDTARVDQSTVRFNLIFSTTKMNVLSTLSKPLSSTKDLSDAQHLRIKHEKNMGHLLSKGKCHHLSKNSLTSSFFPLLLCFPILFICLHLTLFLFCSTLSSCHCSW